MFNNGLYFQRTTPSYSYFLNTYPGASQAYSFRKLSSTYTGFCCRIINRTSGLTQDIGFVNNFVDTASIISFTGVNICDIIIMYDQSGNARDTTFTVNFRPRICNNGALFYESGNLVGSGAVNRIQGTFTPYAMTDISVFITHNVVGVGSFAGYYTNRATSQKGVLITSNAGSSWQSSLIPLNTSGTEVTGRLKSRSSIKSTPTGLYIENWIYNDATNSHDLEETGISVGLTNSLTGWGTITNLGRWGGNAGNGLQHNFCEMIIYDSDQSANKTAINNEIKTFYGL